MAENSHTPTTSEIQHPDIDSAFDDLYGLIEAMRMSGRAIDSPKAPKDAIEALCNAMAEHVKSIEVAVSP